VINVLVRTHIEHLVLIAGEVFKAGERASGRCGQYSGGSGNIFEQPRAGVPQVVHMLIRGHIEHMLYRRWYR
jgi:hypothetical protein